MCVLSIIFQISFVHFFIKFLVFNFCIIFLHVFLSYFQNFRDLCLFRAREVYLCEMIVLLFLLYITLYNWCLVLSLHLY